MPITINGTGTITGISAGGLPDATITTADVVDLNITPEKLSQKLTSGTAVSASGTSIDFTGIPSWVRRITVMFNGLSSNGSSNFIVQLGDSGGIEATGYTSSADDSVTITAATTGLLIVSSGIPAYTSNGFITINLISSNIYVAMGNATSDRTAGSLVNMSFSGGKTLSSTLDRVRITTVNGTDTFDAGSINILYE